MSTAIVRLSASFVLLTSLMALAAGPLSAQPAASSGGPPIGVAVDAREVVRGILHVSETVPVGPGPLTLVYPKWIPGEHGPNGPIVNVATIDIHAGSQRLTWRRDQIEMYAFHVDVPAGTTSLDVHFDYLGASVGSYSSNRLATPTMMVLTWNKVLLTPVADDYGTVMIAPSITLPSADWAYATALDGATKTGATVAFAPVTMEKLVDSPLDAGTVTKRWPLGSIDGAPVDIAVFADTNEELAADDKTIGKLRNLVAEMGALYGARHFNHYTFLLTMTDEMPGEGVEHHQSSDDGTDGDFFTDASSFVADGDLLPHEFNHSWDGKYRRPADLATRNLQTPMQDDLLWVYEGMTQFYGNLQATRAGIHSFEQWRDTLATDYAELDTTVGRQTTPLLDTAVAGPYLYGAPRGFASARRQVDFYIEGQLMWLEADVTIRRMSGGKKSIDDFSRAFFGRTSTGPQVVPYTRADVIAALNAVQPYDWAAFFNRYIDAIAPHPPNPFEAAGWRLVYKPEQSPLAKIFAGKSKGFDARYSIGIQGRTDGTINDVIPGSPAAIAGIGPGVKIIGVDGRATSDGMQSALDASLKRAQGGTAMHLLTLAGGVYRDVAVSYTGGPRFPTLERVDGSADLLSVIAKPRRANP